MRIAISSKDGRSVCGHAGRARRWRVREADGSLHTLELAREQLFHNWDGPAGEHPLEAMDVVVTASAGEGFQRRLAKQGIRVLVTAETSAERVFASVLAGEPLAKPRFNPLLLACKVLDRLGRH